MKVIAQLSEQLLAWWDDHGRKTLPWQREQTPYRVWVSEIMLQQTQVSTVIGYYDRFMETFPDVKSLAAADEDAVLHLWTGLGYYSRARNLHKAAQQVMAEHNGTLPEEIDQLMSLPGIGRSTAGAVLSLACGQRHPILDGNAKRVLARVFGVTGWPGQTAVAKELWMLADDCTPQERVNDYTQAIMDLGAGICSRRNPKCEDCPLVAMCKASASGRVHEIPSSKPKKVKPKKETVMPMLVNGAEVLLEKRPASGIWGGLYSFPELASEAEIEDWCRKITGHEPTATLLWDTVKHSFSHYDLMMQPVRVDIQRFDRKVMDDDRWLWYNTAAPAEVGLAAPVKKLLQRFGEEL